MRFEVDFLVIGFAKIRLNAHLVAENVAEMSTKTHKKTIAIIS